MSNFNYQIMSDNNERCIIYLTGEFDGTQGEGEVANTKIIGSLLPGALAMDANNMVLVSAGGQPRNSYRYTISRITHNVNMPGGFISIGWDSTKNSIYDARGQFDLNYQDSLGPLPVTPISSTGNVTFTAVNATGNNSYSIMLELQKDKRDFNAGQVQRPNDFNAVMNGITRYDYYGPTLAYDFTTLTSLANTGITFTRASSATYYDATGTLQTATSNTPRFDFGNTPGGATNWVQNSSLIGAVVGTPGVDPTTWNLSSNLPSTITKQIMAIGSYNGIPTIDVRYYGTPTSNGNFFPSMGNINTNISNTQPVCSSIYTALVGGSFYNISDTPVVVTNYPLNNRNLAFLPNWSATLTRSYSSNIPPDIGDTYCSPLFFNIPYTANVPLDFTLRIGAPQLEVGVTTPSPWVPTSSGPANIGAKQLGLFVEEGRTNSIRNNTMVGAATGTPGTLPTNWTMVTNSGITTSIVNVGTENGIPYVDVHWTGNTSSVTGLNLFTETNVATPAAVGQTWTTSWYIRLTGGSWGTPSQLPGLLTHEFDVNGSSIVINTKFFAPLPTSAPLNYNRYTSTYTTTSSNIAYINTNFYVQYAANTAIDLTLRIGAPQLELGPLVTSPILTSGSATTRAVDSASMPVSNTWFNPQQGSLMFDVISPPQQNAGRFNYNLGGFYNNSYSSYIDMFIPQNSTISGSVFRIYPGGEYLNYSAAAAVTANSKTKVAGTYSVYGATKYLNGAFAQSQLATSLPNDITTLIFGTINGGGQNNLDGYVRKFKYWPRQLSNNELQQITQ